MLKYFKAFKEIIAENKNRNKPIEIITKCVGFKFCFV